MDLINNTQKVDSKEEKIKKVIKTTIIVLILLFAISSAFIFKYISSSFSFHFSHPFKIIFFYLSYIFIISNFFNFVKYS